MTDSDPRSALYLSHRMALIDYATRILGSREAAEDVVQEAFLKFVPARSESPETLRSYLFRIVRNLAFDLHRRRRTERRWEEDPPAWVTPASVADPEQATLFCDELREITLILASMPREVRVAVEMHRYGGYRLEAIAVHLGVSLPTVHRMIRSAIAEIADRLDRKKS